MPAFLPIAVGALGAFEIASLAYNHTIGATKQRRLRDANLLLGPNPTSDLDAALFRSERDGRAFDLIGEAEDDIGLFASQLGAIGNAEETAALAGEHLDAIEASAQSSSPSPAETYAMGRALFQR